MSLKHDVTLLCDAEFKYVENEKIKYKKIPKGTVVVWAGVDDKGNVLVQKGDSWQWVKKDIVQKVEKSSLPLPPMPLPSIPLPRIPLP